MTILVNFFDKPWEIIIDTRFNLIFAVVVIIIIIFY